MIQRMKNYIAAFMLTMVMVLAPAAAGAISLSAAGSGAQTFGSLKAQACEGLKQVDASQGCGKGEGAIKKVVNTVVRIISYLVGIAAVIAIILAGFKYVTSGGDSNKVASAKTTLIYALVGIAVVALAQFFVNYVFTQASSATK